MQLVKKPSPIRDFSFGVGWVLSSLEEVIFQPA